MSSVPRSSTTPPGGDVAVAAEADDASRPPGEPAGLFGRDSVDPRELSVVVVVPVSVEHDVRPGRLDSCGDQ